MPQSLSSVLVHFVFSTKDRYPYIDDGVMEAFHAYLASISRGLNCVTFRVGGVEDHVHFAVGLAREVSQSVWIEHVKTESSRWIKTQGEQYANFAWQRGYGVFSISPSHLPSLIEYINDQKEHHRRETFQDEYRRLLRKYGLAFDEKYVWG
ncbi:transposase [Cerasicoccus fimbriatus]|uniref:transposase n=1 Tax=Cerasicoccus fimbriatus TaxID=3014554 RepID=UPI0022B5AE4E|nr:transposase [Cerasicoccus sp. TK19100]